METATTSPAATRRVSAEPSSAALRASSCWTRAAAVIQLVTAARCSMVSPSAVSTAQHTAISAAGQGEPGAGAVDDRLYGRSRREREARQTAPEVQQPPGQRT